METNQSSSDGNDIPRLKSADAAAPADAVEDEVMDVRTEGTEGMEGDPQQEGNAQSVRSGQQGGSEQGQAVHEESRQANGEPDREDDGARQDDEALSDANTLGKSTEASDHSKWPFARKPVDQAGTSAEQ